MREKLRKFDASKVFWAGVLFVLAAYGLLCLINSLCVTVLVREDGYCLQHYNFINARKFSVPFPYGILFFLEWALPLFLVLSYVLLAVGQIRIYIMTAAFMGSGVVISCFGGWGRAHGYAQSETAWELFCSNSFRAADDRIRMYLPITFCLWILAALILTVSASCIWKCFKSRKSKIAGLTAVFLVSLSEGILFNIVYFGQYTIFYIVRSLLIVLLILLAVYWLNAESADAVRNIAKAENAVKQPKQKIIFVVGMSLCILIYVLAAVIYVYRLYYPAGIPLLYLANRIMMSWHFPMLVAASVSAFMIRSKRTPLFYGTMAFVLCTAETMWRYYYYPRQNVPWLSMLLADTMIGIVFLYLLLSQFIKVNKKIKIVFIVMIYLIGIGSVFFGYSSTVYEKTFGMIFGFIFLCMMGITLYGLISLPNSEEDKKVKKSGIGIWILLCGFVVIAWIDFWIYDWVHQIDVLSFLKSYRMLWSVSQVIETNMFIRGAGSGVSYLFAFFAVLACLAHAMKKKDLFVVASITVFGTAYMLEADRFYWIGEQIWYVLLPIPILVMLILLFLLPFIEKLFPEVRKGMGILLTVITYGVLFYYFVYPLFEIVRDRGKIIMKYRIWMYVLAQLILFVIALITLAIYVKKETAEQEEPAVGKISFERENEG